MDGLIHSGQFGGELNDRLTRLAYATQLLDQAVVAGDELDRILAEHIASLSRHDTTQASPLTTIHDGSSGEGATT